jgi:hypothetical protein
MINGIDYVYGYDFDGVISIGISPMSKEDVIITGRCIDEKNLILNELRKRKIFNKVYFNPMTLQERGNHTEEARTYSALHKAKKINELKETGLIVVRFFEDDELQKEIIQKSHPDLEIVHVVSNLVQK